MDLQSFSGWFSAFYAQYPIFCYIIIALLVVLLLWKPVKVIKTSLFFLVLLVIVYIAFSLLDGMEFGVGQKEKGLQRSEKMLNE